MFWYVFARSPVKIDFLHKVTKAIWFSTAYRHISQNTGTPSTWGYGWAAWCSPCIKSIPQIQALHEIYKEEDLVILGTNSWEERQDNLDSFLKEYNITYRVLLDSDDKVIGEYKVEGIPTTFLIDKNGIIRYSTLGLSNNKNIIQRHIEELLAK